MKAENRTSYQHIDITPYAPVVGAQINNIDLAAPISKAVRSELLRAHGEYGVLFFHDQSLSPDQHIDFAQSLGDINVNRFFKPVDSYPRIAEVRKNPDQKTNIGSKWHTDHSYDQEPALGSILYAREIPDSGGDTLFSSMYAAHDALSDGMKKMLGSMKAEHTSRKNFGKEAYGTHKDAADVGSRLGNVDAATQDSVHPVLITHPVSGRKALYVNDSFTVKFEGWTEAESKPLLDYLYAHASQPEFTCRFKWREGSIAFWDNRCTWHKALNDYDGQTRLMHRITLEGTALS